MQIQLHTDNHVHGDETLAEWAERELRTRLHRFADHLTRVEVHLADVNPRHVSGHDKRCTLEARLAGRQPVAVHHDAEKVADALHGATEKLVRSLDSALGKVRDAHGRDTIRGA